MTEEQYRRIAKALDRLTARHIRLRKAGCDDGVIAETSSAIALDATNSELKTVLAQIAKELGVPIGDVVKQLNDVLAAGRQRSKH